MGKKKAAAKTGGPQVSVNGTTSEDEAPLKPGEAARRIEESLRSLHEQGAFRSPYYDRLLHRKPLGITLEDVEKLPYEDITADMPDWPGRKSQTAQS